MPIEVIQPTLISWKLAKHDIDRKNLERWFTQRWDNEAQFQVRLVPVLYAVSDPSFILNFDIGGSRSRISGAHHKAMGHQAGWPDLFCGWAGRMPNFGFMELKASKGYPETKQKAMASRLRGLGWNHAYIRTMAEAIAALAAWGCPIREEYKPLAELG